MKNEHIILLLLGVIVLCGLGYLIVNGIVGKLSPGNLEECKTLRYSGENAINIVFFSDKNTIEQNVDYFLNSAPYNESVNKFNLYYIDSYTPKCEIYKGMALLCSSSELIKKAASCPNDYIVVLQDTNQSIRSSSYQNVISINKKSPLNTLVHEFAHAFAGLDDEYIPSTIGFGSKNCLSNCKNFDGKEDSCTSGCGDANHYRSIELGVMKTLAVNNYGKFDAGIIAKLLDKIKTTGNINANAIAQVGSCNSQKYYLIVGNVSGLDIEILRKSIEVGCASSLNSYGNGSGNYNYDLVDSSGNALSAGRVGGNVYLDVLNTDGTTVGGTLPGNVFYMTVPFVENQQLNINIKDMAGVDIKSINLEGKSNMACRIK